MTLADHRVGADPRSGVKPDRAAARVGSCTRSGRASSMGTIRGPHGPGTEKHGRPLVLPCDKTQSQTLGGNYANRYRIIGRHICHDPAGSHWPWLEPSHDYGQERIINIPRLISD